MSQQSHSRTGSEGWENEGGSLRPKPPEEYSGVTRLMAETFAVGRYRYTNLADAVAQAKRVEILAEAPDARAPF